MKKQSQKPLIKPPPHGYAFLLASMLIVYGGGHLSAQVKVTGPAKANAAKAEKPVSEEGFDKQSLALRTALHYDSSLNAPLQGLIRLYQKAGRSEDLLGLYRAHTSQYGEDVGAKVVMVRLLKELDRVEAGEMIQSASQQHPEHPELKYLLYQEYKKRGDQRSLETLSAAIDLQKVAVRRQLWMDELLVQAQENEARALAERHLRESLSVKDHSASTLLSLARQMHRYHFEELSLLALKRAMEKNQDAETGVEIDLLAARAEASLGRFEALAKRMDVLLKRLAPDYHRRSEIMKLRMSLVKNNADRDQLLEQAKQRYEKEPQNESAVLDYAELLSANEMRRKAVEVMLAGANRLPKSERLEKEVLRLLDRIGDEEGMMTFLQERLKGDSSRDDLQYRLVKAEYLAGKAKSARPRLEKIIAKLGDEERARRLLDLARYLRQMSQPTESAALLEEVMVLMPSRLDVQRELLETLLALEQRDKAEKLLASISIEDAEIENFVDLVQFMLQADFLVDARDALEARLKIEEGNLDLNLLLVSVLGKTGGHKKAEDILMEIRVQADTAARYAQWLESGMELYELLETPEQFFDAEQFRFLEKGGEWTADRVDRFLTLCELGERKRLAGRVAQALRNQLADDSLPAPLKLRLRMLLVKALDKSPENAGEVEQQLELLAKEDKKRADDYQLRRALLYHSNSRPDLAQSLLAAIEMEKVNDESLLRAAYLVFLEYSMVENAKICLKKLTAMEPNDSGGWEKRLSLLAALGEEEELRVVLRRLLAGIDRMVLKPETLQALRVHLLDSYWRSISSLLQRGDAEALGEVLVHLDSVDRDAGQTRDRSWSLWARAYALNLLDRGAARDEVIKDLRAFFEKESADKNSDKSVQAMIAFPDGLAVSLEAAETLLKSKKEENQEASAVIEDSEGPLGALEMAWAFEADPGARILQIAPIGGGSVLVLDDQGGVYNVDAESGKLRWHEQYRIFAAGEGATSSRRTSRGSGGITISNSQFQVRQQGNSIMVQQLSAPYQSVGLGARASYSASYLVSGVKQVRSMLVDGAGGEVGEGVFFMADGNQIRSYRSKDGSLLWQSDLALAGLGDLGIGRNSQPVARPEPVMFLDGDHLLCYAPGLDVACCYQKKSGKLVWSRGLGEPSSSPAAPANGTVYSLNSGASFSAGHLFVFGRSCAILDSATGKTLWSFDDRGVHRFPVTLGRVREDEQPSGAEGKAKTGGPAPTQAAAQPSLVSTLVGNRAVVAQPSAILIDHSNDGSGVMSRMGEVKPFLQGQGQGALVAPAVQWNGLRVLGRGSSDAQIARNRLLLMGTHGLREISLALPIASNQYGVNGVLIGTTGDKAWFLNGSVLRQIGLEDDHYMDVKIDELPEAESETRAVLSGSRIYVSHARGLTVLNAHSGKVISESPWPDLMADYLVKRGAKMAGVAGVGGQKVATWQGYVRTVPGRPVYCYPIRNQLKGGSLFTLV